MKYHPASEFFLLMEGEEIPRLKADIQKNGCHESIIVLDDMILDGRNRYRACEELDIKPPITEWCSDKNPMDFVLSMNLHRRHLTASQQAMVAAEAAKFYEQDAKDKRTTVVLPQGNRKHLVQIWSKCPGVLLNKQPEWWVHPLHMRTKPRQLRSNGPI